MECYKFKRAQAVWARGREEEMGLIQGVEAVHVIAHHLYHSHVLRLGQLPGKGDLVYIVESVGAGPAHMERGCRFAAALIYDGG